MKWRLFIFRASVACAAAAALIIALAVGITESRIVILGHLRREQFFMGKPLSYWRTKVKRGEFTCGGWTHTASLEKDPPFWLCGPKWTHAVLSALGINTNPNLYIRFDPTDRTNFGANGALVPLLRELLRDPDPAIRWVAAFAMGTYSDGATEDLLALRKAAHDEDEQVPKFAALSLLERNWSIQQKESNQSRHVPNVSKQ
jgi:hypothetical protein